MGESDYWRTWSAWVDECIKPRRHRRTAKFHRNLADMQCVAECYGIRILVPDGWHHIQFRYLDYIGNYYPSTRKFFMQSPLLLPTERGVPPEQAMRLFLITALKLESEPKAVYESSWSFSDGYGIPDDVQHVGEYVLPRVRQEILRIGAFRRDAIDLIQPREFEHLVATLLQGEGFTCVVTPASRDGGKDIVAIQSVAGREFVTFVECKKWLAENVGVDIVQRAIGVKYIDKADHSMIVTTARFTAPAMQVASRVVDELTLIDRETFDRWLLRYHRKRTVVVGTE